MAGPFKMKGFSGFGNSPLKQGKEPRGWKGEYSESDYKEFSKYETARTTGKSTGDYSGYQKDWKKNRKMVIDKMGGAGHHMASWNAMTKRFKAENP